MSGFAPGKAILLGEHAVVHGHRAIALAIDRGTTVTLEPQRGRSCALPPCPDDPRLLPALQTLLPLEGIGVRIDSALPVGRGLGSSAALAVALVRALAEREGRTASHEECIESAMKVERVFHGNPSGIDHTVSTYGGAVVFQRGGPVTPLPVPPLPLVVLDSGETGDTAQLVAAVTARRPGIDPALEAIGELVEDALLALADHENLGALMVRNHELLGTLGVSTPRLDALVDLALGAGAAGAKLAGAGGGGVVLALAADPKAIVDHALEAGIDAFAVGIHPAS